MRKQKEHRFKSGLARALELPRDLAYRESVLTLSGQTEITVENYRSLLRYCSDQIVVLTRNGPLEIRGKSMEIVYYTEEEMKITGCICQVYWKNL